MLTKKLRMMVLPLALVLFVSSVALAAPMTTNSKTMPQASKTGSHGSNDVFPGISPVTGLAWEGDYRPLVVQISNDANARPHYNMSEADVVYESILWGPGHTRYTLIFSDNHPDYVGAMRSIRWHHCAIRQEWDTLFVFWGGQATSGSSIVDFFKNNGVDKAFRIDGTGNYGNSSKAMFRENVRVSPHNAIANLQQIVAENWPVINGKAYEPKIHAFKFSSTAPSTSTDTAVQIDLVYDPKSSKPVYAPSYTYNASLRLYERSYCGEPQVDGKTNKRIVASNVIVQYCETSYVNNAAARPLITMTGSGPIDAFIDGKHIRGTWERKGMNERTAFLDMAGNELVFMPGKTFIQVVPLNFEFSYTHADNSTATLNSGTQVAEVVLEGADDTAEMDKMD